jgi:hypothetical protein
MVNVDARARLSLRVHALQSAEGPVGLGGGRIE